MIDHKRNIERRPPFDHVASDLVDVFPTQEGEQVQVWDGPKTMADRFLMLAYFRTENGVVGMNVRIKLDDGPYKMVQTNGSSRTYFYKGDTKDCRLEKFLPSGRLLIDDKRSGFSIRRNYCADFDFEKRKPKGKKLSDRATIDLQMEGKTWYVALYQDTAEGESTLRAVEVHEGLNLVRVVEFPVEDKPVPKDS